MRPTHAPAESGKSGPIISADVNFSGVLAAIHQRCFADGWSESAMRTLLGQPGVSGLVATAGDPVGFVLSRRVMDEMEILTLCVVPEARRQRIATRLLHVALESAPNMGVHRVFLEVAMMNDGALRLYNQAGFMVAGQRPGYYRNRDGSLLDAVILARQFTDAHASSIDGGTRAKIV